MPLVAEGLRKFGMLARLIATGIILDNGYLFWDEPEANLNPRMVAKLAETIISLPNLHGVQVFIATHSLFLMRSFEMISNGNLPTNTQRISSAYTPQGDHVGIEQVIRSDDIGDISSLDEELAQSDRYLKSGT